MLIRSNIKIFTYEDCLHYLEFIENNPYFHSKYFINDNINKLEDTSEVYSLYNSKIINNQDDKLFRKMLDIKFEAASFINNVLHINISPNQLEKYNRSFVTSDLENRQSDIIYKIKNRNIFFLIEHQTKIDNSMPFRIVEYSSEIIKSAIDYSKFKNKNYKLPLVIPIVIYTGKTKWDIKKYIGDIQENLNGFNELKYGEFKYVDINNYEEKTLLKSKDYFSKLLLLVKYKSDNTMSKVLDEILKGFSKNTDYYQKDSIEVLKLAIFTFLSKKVGNEKAYEFIKKLDEGGDFDMEELIEQRVEEENEYFKNLGKIEGLKLTALNMLKENMPLELIKKITGLSIKSIKELK